MTVCSFTPSRIAIITSRRTYSKPSVGAVNFAGVSDGSEGYCGACGVWATTAMAARGRNRPDTMARISAGMLPATWSILKAARMPHGTFIDVDRWKRRQHFELYRRLTQPFWSVTVDVDVTAIWDA